MGMTDRQFDAYLENLLARLRFAQKELAGRGEKSEELDALIESIVSQLKRP